MNPYMTLPDAVAELAAVNLPVLCLDTCDFIDVVRGVAEGSLDQIQLFRKIQENLAVGPRPIRVVVTYLVRHEWVQNKDAAVKKVDGFLQDLSKTIERVVQARRLARLSELKRDRIADEPALSRSLLELAENILDHSIVLEKDATCVNKALERVMAHRRPSHKNEIKDSINWEHYLELSTRLINSGHDEDRIFVSANRKDFWTDVEGKEKEKRPTIHRDLEAEANAAGLQFFGRLDEALRVLGV